MEVEISRIGIVESFLKIEETQDGSLRNMYYLKLYYVVN